MSKNFDCLLIPALIIFGVMVMAGCAMTRPGELAGTIASPPEEIASSDGWWFARFRMQWPVGEAVNWHWDLLIAHRIVASVLEQYQDQIRLWRFHRRANRDEAGHQFSFIFFTSAETAGEVFNQLRSNELLSELISAQMVIEDLYDNTDRIAKPRIEDASDQNWPLSIQKNWPYFIMGVSRMWLNLISDAIGGMPDSGSPLSLQEIEVQYKKANAAVSELWQNEGQHAFLHHLSAVFGYRAIIFYDKRMLKF